MNSTDPLRQHLINLLTKAEAHMDVRSTLENFPPELRGRKSAGAPHTPWQLLEHMRIAQWDILEFSLSATYVPPKWPKDYWPTDEAPPTQSAWQKSVTQFLEDLNRVCQMVADPRVDLFTKIPHGDGQTYMREVLLVADHNAYHVGQLVMLRRIAEGKLYETFLFSTHSI